MAYTPYYSGGWQNGEEGSTPVTPAALNNMENGIGAALPKSGGTMTGDIDMGQSTETSGAKNVIWTTADGTVFRLRPYNNIMQMTRQAPGSSQSNVLGVNSDGTYSIGNVSNFRTAIGASSGVWPVTIGGTGGATTEDARANLETAYTTYVNVNTWGALFPELNKIGSGDAGVFLLSPDAASVLSNGKISAYLVATIFRTDSSGSYTFRVSASSDTGAHQYAWKITSANASGRTTGTVYQYNGTAMT